MDTLTLSSEIAELFRLSNVEQIGIALAEDLNIQSVGILGNLSEDSNQVMIVTHEDFNIIIHNHLNNQGFSTVDIENMLPNIYYILITKSQILGMYNFKEVKCVLI